MEGKGGPLRELGGVEGLGPRLQLGGFKDRDCAARVGEDGHELVPAAYKGAAGAGHEPAGGAEGDTAFVLGSSIEAVEEAGGIRCVLGVDLEGGAGPQVLLAQTPGAPPLLFLPHPPIF